MASTKGIRAGRAFVELFADDSRLVRGLRAAEKKLKAFGESVRKLGLKLMGLGTAMVTPLLAAGRVFAGMGDEIGKLSVRTGVGVETLSELGYAAEQSGTSLRALGQTLFRMNRRIANAATGSGPAVRALREMGFSAEELSKLDAAAQFKLIADRLNVMKHPALAAQYAFEVLGDNARDLMPLLRQGSVGMDALAAEARRLGLTMQGEDVVAAQALGDAMTRLWKVVKMTTYQIGAALAPTLTRIVDTLTRVAVRVNAWIEQNRQWVVQVLKVAAAVVAAGAALVVLGTVVSGLAAALGVLASVITGIGTAFGVVASAIGLLISPVGLAIAAVTTLGVVLLKTSGVGAQALAWLGERFESLKNTAMRAWRGVADALAAGDIALATRVLWVALRVEWLKGVQYLKGLWLGFKANFLKVATEAFYGAVKIAAGAWAGLRAAWVQTAAFLKRVWTSFTATLASAHRIAVGFVERQLHRLRGMFDEAYNVEAAIAIAQSNEQADLKRIEADKQSDLTASEQQRRQQLAAIGQAFEDTAKALDQAAADATERQRQAAQAQMNAAVADLEQARREYQATLDQAARKRTASDVTGDDDGPRSIQSLLDQIEGLGASLSAAQRTLSARGTFAAAAIQSLQQASPLDQRIADASEETARNTRRLLQQTQTGPVFG